MTGMTTVGEMTGKAVSSGNAARIGQQARTGNSMKASLRALGIMMPALLIILGRMMMTRSWQEKVAKTLKMTAAGKAGKIGNGIATAHTARIGRATRSGERMKAGTKKASVGMNWAQISQEKVHNQH